MTPQTEITGWFLWTAIQHMHANLMKKHLQKATSSGVHNVDRDSPAIRETPINAMFGAQLVQPGLTSVEMLRRFFFLSRARP